MDIRNQVIRKLMHTKKYAAIAEFAKINNDDRDESIVVSEYAGDTPRLMIRDKEIHILCPKEMTVVQEEGIADSIANGTIFDDASLLNDQAEYMQRTILPMNAIANKHGIEPKKIKVLITGVMGRINNDGNIEISFGDVENSKNFLDDITSGRGCEHVNKICDHYLGIKNDSDRMEGHCSLPLDIRRDIHDLTKEIDSITDVSPEDEVTADDFDPFDKVYDIKDIETDHHHYDESDKPDDDIDDKEPDVDADDAEVEADDNMKGEDKDDESESDEKEENEDDSSEEDTKESTEDDDDEGSDDEGSDEEPVKDEEKDEEFESEDDDDDSALDNESEENDKKKSKKKSEKKSKKKTKKEDAESAAEEIEDETENIVESYIGEGFLSKHPKKLKPIPRDIVSYITIEMNAIRDANDQAMIAGYCSAKLELVDFYLNCIDTQDARYLVPHNRQYLVQMQTELNDLLKRILQIKPVNKYDRIWSGIL